MLFATISAIVMPQKVSTGIRRFQHMVIHNTACTVSAGIGGAHIVGIELREHRAAQHFDSHGTARKCNGGRRCNKITDKTGKIFRNRHIGARLKPFENQTEKIRDQNTDEKSRHRHDHLIDRHDQPVQMASGVLCCENADGNRDNKDHQECDNGDSMVIGTLSRISSPTGIEYEYEVPRSP